MKFGAICPIPHLREFAVGDFHLVLYHLLRDEPTYKRHYAEQASLGAFITVDNSAFELGYPADPDLLLDMAIEIGAKEIAVADKLMDYEGTLDATYEALRSYMKRKTDLLKYEIRLLLIPQARTIYKWNQCLAKQMELMKRMVPGVPFTIGVAKNFESFVGGRANLIGRFLEPLRGDCDFETHLLGFGNEMNQLGESALRFPWIRSTDSVKPFTYALTLSELPAGYAPTPPNPGRPEDFFHLKMTSGQLRVAALNVQAVHEKINPKIIERVGVA